MNAMRIHRIGPIDEGEPPLRLDRVEVPVPGVGEVLIRVHACGVCHTELDEIEGRTAPPVFPVVPGREVIGRGDGIAVTDWGSNLKER